MKPGPKTQPSKTLFEKHVAAGRNGCLEWTGHLSPDGYGRFLWRRRCTGAHRVSWMLRYGPVPDGKFVLHSCDNRRCVNTEHLFLGTQLDNVSDMIRKGRSSPAIGENTRHAKLTRPSVVLIRQRRSAGESCAALGRAFGVCPTSIRRLCDGSSWRHVVV